MPDKQLFTVWCPFCRAEPGEPCRSVLPGGDNRPMGNLVHVARRNRARPQRGKLNGRKLYPYGPRLDP